MQMVHLVLRKVFLFFIFSLTREVLKSPLRVYFFFMFLGLLKQIQVQLQLLDTKISWICRGSRGFAEVPEFGSLGFHNHVFVEYLVLLKVLNKKMNRLKWPCQFKPGCLGIM